jgi:cholesterol oxidase
LCVGLIIPVLRVVECFPPGGLEPEFDYVVVMIGSGFGGSVATLRAAEKGYGAGIIDVGRRWKDEDIPKTMWDLKHYVWFPAGELYGT